MTRTLLLTGALLASNARADCSEWGFQVWPPAEIELRPNARLVIQGFGLAQPLVAAMAERHPRLTAQSADSFTFTPPVPLKVVETRQGEMQLTQAVLQPERPLFPGTRYTLKFDILADEEPIFAQKKPNQWIAWGEPDVTAPGWSTAPTPSPGNFKRMGCGPIEEARVQLAVKDESPYLVLARVQAASGPVREYLLTPKKEGELLIGHGMCSGAFRLGEDEWSLELVAVDLAGNRTPAPGGPLRFKGIAPKK